MGQKSRTKGAVYEREVSTAIFEALGVRTKRNLSQYQQSEEGDLDLAPFLIECKRRKSIAIYDWMTQAITAAATKGRIPVVAMRADGKESLVVLRMKDALPLLGNELSPPEHSQD